MTIKKVSMPKLANGLASSECLQEIVFAYTSYLKVAEEERTKRRGISTWEKVAINKVIAQRDFLMNYLELSFDERAKNFDRLFGLVDQAIAAGNHEQLALVLNSINELAKSSPFKDLVSLSTVQAALDDPEHRWEF